MVTFLSERENALEDINSICERIFDLCCERRSVVPLSYLMREWPFASSDPEQIRRLDSSMGYLRRLYQDALGNEVFDLLNELLDRIAGLPNGRPECS